MSNGQRLQQRKRAHPRYKDRRQRKAKQKNAKTHLQFEFFIRLESTAEKRLPADRSPADPEPSVCRQPGHFIHFVMKGAIYKVQAIIIIITVLGKK